MGNFKTWFESNAQSDEDSQMKRLYDKILSALKGSDKTSNILATGLGEIQDRHTGKKGLTAVNDIFRNSGVFADMDNISSLAGQRQQLSAWLNDHDKKTDQGRSAGSMSIGVLMQQVFGQHVSPQGELIPQTKAQMPQQPPVQDGQSSPQNMANPQDQQPPNPQQPPPPQDPAAAPQGVNPMEDPNIPKPQGGPEGTIKMSHYKPQGKGIFEAWVARHRR